MIDEIISHAQGSIFRLNAESAKFFSFTLLNTRGTWQGGWCWSKDPFDGEDYTYGLVTGKFYTNKDKERDSCNILRKYSRNACENCHFSDICIKGCRQVCPVILQRHTITAELIINQYSQI